MTEEEKLARRREQKREAARTWYAKHKEKHREGVARCDVARKAKDPESFMAKRREAQRKQRIAKGATPRDQHVNLSPEVVKQRARAAHIRWKSIPGNAEYLKQLQRSCSAVYKQAHPEQCAAAVEKYRREHPDRIRELNRRSRHNRRLIESSLVPLNIEDWETTGQLFNGRCLYCNGPATTLDHIIPVSRGGDNSKSNCVPACQRCNASKGNKPLIQWLTTSKIAREALADLQP